MMTNKESKGCKWCEDTDSVLTLYSKSDGEIHGFCSESCWRSYKEVIFDELRLKCPKCGNSLNLLQVPAANKDDLLNEGFVNYCDNYCLSKNVNSKTANKPANHSAKQQSTAVKIEKTDKINESSSNDTINSTPNQSMNTSSVRRTRGLKNHNPYEIFGCFNWENYLKLEKSTPAPAECFRQNSEPPTNEFEIDMKLEAPDPRNTESMCIATVVSVMGFRIELRLDGTDNTNDFWLPVDSEMIRPIGYTQERGGMLQPPLGFRKSPSNWPVFVSNTLNNAVIAPKSCFKEPPLPPKKNLFKVGQKLEAVDKKNPQLICPATITLIRDSMVFVSFDGWKGAFDYWTRYDSRDLFPVGWCERSQHPLQLPGNKDLKIDANQLSVNFMVNILYKSVKVKNSNKSMNSSKTMELNFSSDSDKNNHSSSNDKINDANNNSSNSTTAAINQTSSTVISNTSTSSATTPVATITNQKSSTLPVSNSSTIHTSTTTVINNNNLKSESLISSAKTTPKAPVISNVNSHLVRLNKSSSFQPTQSSTPPSSSIKALLLDKNKQSSKVVNSSAVTSTMADAKRQVNGVVNVNKTAANTSSSLINHSSIINHSSTNHHPVTISQANQRNENTNNTNKHPLVTVYLNLNCNPGEYISIQEYKRMCTQCNSKIGPSQLNKTMKDILQLIVNCCRQDCKTYILEMIRPGNGSFEVETGLAENAKIKLPHFNRASAFWNYLNNFLGGLKCCKNLVSMRPVECIDCVNNKSKESLNKSQQPLISMINKQTPAKSNQTIKPKLNHHSTPISNTNTKTIIASNPTPQTPVQTTTTTATPKQPSSIANHTTATLKRKTEDQNLANKNNKAVKTNGHHMPADSTELSNPNNWSIDDVIKFLKMNDESLDFSELFKAHEIDGKAFLLLDSEMLMKYMKIKLGPALKIASIIDQLKRDQID